MADTWQTVGIVLAELVFASGVAWLTRLFSAHKIEGQTFAMVVLGVAGVVSIAGFQIGWERVGYLALCFAVAAVPMGVEYYSRFIVEQKKAREAAQDIFDGNASTTR